MLIEQQAQIQDALTAFSTAKDVKAFIAYYKEFINCNSVEDLQRLACIKRDRYWGHNISYSPKVFLPLTHLCRDVCHYCTFAKTPKKLNTLFMPIEQVIAKVKEAERLGCKEALLTLGEKPELRYSTAIQWLKEQGFNSTIDYVEYVAKQITQHSNLLPHINAGCLTRQQYRRLKKVSVSVGLMLESASQRLCEPGMPHYGSPDKQPEARIASIEMAGQEKVPFTSGLLVGIGETFIERIEALFILRDLHLRYGHIQELIIQNFVPKPHTKMAAAQSIAPEKFAQIVAIARLIMPAQVSIQAPPNLNAKHLNLLLEAGINDWGGVSPLTIDYVNPGSPWPVVEQLSDICVANDKNLIPRLAVYPEFIRNIVASIADQNNDADFIDADMLAKTLRLCDAQYYAKQHQWSSGISDAVDDSLLRSFEQNKYRLKTLNKQSDLASIFDDVDRQHPLNENQINFLLCSRGESFLAVCEKADQLRQYYCGDTVSYVVNKNINYTNICGFKCRFCAFSKGSKKAINKQAAYRLSLDQIVLQATQAYSTGATEICLQGGIHPHYTGQTYIDICAAIREALPNVHIHAFSPLEIKHGAQTLGLSIDLFLQKLKKAGLNSLPGTAAEILDDEIRQIICADKLNTQQWLNIMRSAHRLGIKSTATMMFGHVDTPKHWARHLIHLRQLQIETRGFSEFVPLPFVADQAPMFIQGQSRSGPDIREAILVHAVARLVLSPWLNNIQGSWVKMGEQGLKLCLQAGANDMGGTLMSESITRAAGAQHGQTQGLDFFNKIGLDLQREIAQRTTAYDILQRHDYKNDDAMKKNIDAVQL